MEAIKSDRIERSMEVSCTTVWNDCLEVIRENVGEENFNTWFKPIVPLRVDGDVLTIQVPSQFFYRGYWRIFHLTGLYTRHDERSMNYAV